MAHYHTRNEDEKLKFKIQRKIRKIRKIKNTSSIGRIETFLNGLKQRSWDVRLTTQRFFQSSYLSIFNVISIVIFCLVLSAPLVLIPQHDSIKNPHYWYEGLIAVQFSYTISTVLFRMMTCKILFELDCLVSLKSFFLMYCALAISIVSLTLAYFAVFVLYLHYDPPVPFCGIVGYVSYFISLFGLWFSIPRAKRIEAQVRKRFWVYFAYDVFNVFILKIVFDVYTIGFKLAPVGMQWIVGIGVPVIRDVGSWLKMKLLNLAFKERNSNLVELITVNVRHAFYLSVALGTFATESTGYVILSLDFTMNIWKVLKITKLHKKVDVKVTSPSEKMKKWQSILSDLALLEIIEFIVPVVFIISLIVAWHGPNSSILGNYGNGYWTFRRIESFDKYVFMAIELFLFDCCSFILGGLILWKCCSINLFRVICQQMKRYWILLAIVLAKSLTSRFALYSVNLGMDYTFQFDWIYGNDYENTSISTSMN